MLSSETTFISLEKLQRFYCKLYQVFSPIGHHHDGLDIDIASTENQGSVRPDGTTITITNAGVISVPTATTSTAGIVRPDGTTITVDPDGTIHGASTYELPTMSPTTKGGALLGRGLEIEDGVLSVATEGDGAIRSVTAEGWAEQDTTTGKNLVYKVFNGHGIGTAGGMTNDSGYDLQVAQVTSGQTYTVSTDDSNLVCGFYSSEPSVGSLTYDSSRVVSSSKTFTAPITGYVAFRTSAGYGTAQLELGSTATEYEPYTGGAPSPSPDYPQEVRVARGRNLLNLDAVTTGYYISNQGVETSSSLMFYSEKIPVTAGETYTVSGVSGSTARVFVSGYDASGTWSQSIVYTNTYAAGATYRESFVIPSGVAYIVVSRATTDTNPQLESGSTPTPYVPYGHVGLEVRGKNLLRLTLTDETVSGVTFTVNADGSITANGTATANIYKDIGRGILQSENVILTGCPSGGSSSTYFMYVAGYGDVSGYDTGNGGTIPPAKQNNSTRIVIMSGTVCSNLVFYPMLRLASVSDSAYVPYHDDTTVPIPLPSKGFAASLPDGTHDTLTIDGAGRVEWESASEEYVVTGTEGTNQGFVSIGDGWGRTVPRVLGNKWSRYSNGLNGYCTHAEFKWDTTTKEYHVSTSNDMILFVGQGESALELTQQYAGARVIYALATPTTEDCGYVDLTITVEGDTVSIPELEDVAVVRWADAVATEVARQWYWRAQAVESRVAALEAAVAEIVTSQ